MEDGIGVLGEDIMSRVHSPSKAWSQRRESKHKGVFRPRTGFGDCREREDLQLSSEVVHWLNGSLIPSPLKVWGEGSDFPLYFKRLCKGLHLTGL